MAFRLLMIIRAIASGFATEFLWTWTSSVFTSAPPFRLPEGKVIPHIILALGGAGVVGSIVSRRPPANTDLGYAGQMVLCWAAAWLIWTIVYAVFTHTHWMAVQALVQTLTIVIAGLLVPLKTPDDRNEVITLHLR